MGNRLQMYNEFLFQLPRRLLKDEKEKLVLTNAERAELKKHLESIRVEFHSLELEYTREENDGAPGRRASQRHGRRAATRLHRSSLQLRCRHGTPPLSASPVARLLASRFSSQLR